jgi:hypothetical protein
VQTSDRCFIARTFAELLKEEKQMRSSPNENIHASSRRKLNWNAIKWKRVERKVKELQIRIAKAVDIRTTGSVWIQSGRRSA